MFGCFNKKKEISPTDRELELAALYNLELPFFSEYFPVSDDKLNEGQKWVNEKREWLKTVPDPRVKKAYAGWFDYVERRINDNRSENLTHKERNGYEQRQKQLDAEIAKGKALNIPKPPK